MIAAHPDRPRHVAIVMDGNGRWADRRGRRRTVGHRVGGLAARRAVECAARSGVAVLTLYAFSQENWARPATEVAVLMRLFARALRQEVPELREQGIHVRFIGTRQRLSATLQDAMHDAERDTASNARMTLLVAVDYGGQWDISQAAAACQREGVAPSPEALAARLSTAMLPEVDLLIRTGGERRLSNFYLWQAAYAELYFSDVLWPDFGAAELEAALRWYAGRERRFGTVADEPAETRGGPVAC